MQIIIVGHIDRMNKIQRLLDYFGRSAVAIIDYKSQGANLAHYRALQKAAEHPDRCIIMEDDAIPVKDFMQKADWALQNSPDIFVSFYLGTGRPRDWQSTVDARLATYPDAEYVWLPTLIHGVCYSPPVKALPSILANMDRKMAADFAIGRAYGMDVLYTLPSLVEHDDGPSVERHPDGQPRRERRKARYLADDLVF